MKYQYTEISEYQDSQPCNWRVTDIFYYKSYKSNM